MHFQSKSQSILYTRAFPASCRDLAQQYTSVRLSTQLADVFNTKTYVRVYTRAR